jgi:putative redox protein
MPARIEPITFPGRSGVELAARMDLPAGPPRAFALFAHCFTCGKDLHAASRIADALTDVGYAVLRFDFTGLGMSGGEFANTDFTSNTDDVLAAADWLRREHRAPQVLVGHSLGGAAVLAVAGAIPEARAVVTIGAPSSPEHVAGLFTSSLAEIEASGEACVQIADRPFTIRRELLDDLHSHAVLDRVATMKKALLVMHSPIDNVVSVDHAADIFVAARHPKSYVALDGADHLLSRPADAAFVASMIGPFADRYVDDEPADAAAPPHGTVTVSETTRGTFLNHVLVGNHRMLADEPVNVGGTDAGPTPYDFLGTALGACTAMTLRMYADRKDLPLDHVTVEVRHRKVHADDCRECVENPLLADRTGLIDRFERVIHVQGDDLSDGDRAKLLTIADKCPVHRS